MSKKTDRLRMFANQIDGCAVDGAAAALREYADRLDAVAVSDAMVECASDAYATLSLDGVDMTAMRHALESILPIADEALRKDAERYKWLRNLSISMLCVRADRWNGMHNVRMIGSELDEAIDRAVASAKGDAR